eukprot:jgi/Tetstr1/463891/TSEL_008702.t1
MSSSGSPTAPKMVDVGKAAAFGGVGTTATEADFIEAARRKAEDIGMKQLIQDKLCRFFTTQETPMPPAADGEADTIPGGNESRAGETTARQRFGEALLRRNDSDRDGGGGSRENF